MSNKLTINFDSDYTQVPNQLFRDNRLSFKAKGLFVQIISLAETWNFSIAGLAALSKESTKAVQSGVDELIEHGYLNWNKTTDDLGRFAVEIDVFLPATDKPRGQTSTGQNVTRQNADYKRKTNKGQTDNQDKNNKIATQQKRDLIFEAICEVSNIDWNKLTDSGRGELGKATKQLKAVDATPDEIRFKAKILRSKFPVAITPSSLVKHWAGLTPESVEQIVTNKERDKALDGYHQEHNARDQLAADTQDLYDRGLIDRQGNYIKQGEIES